MIKLRRKDLNKIRKYIGFSIMAVSKSDSATDYGKILEVIDENGLDKLKLLVLKENKINYVSKGDTSYSYTGRFNFKTHEYYIITSLEELNKHLIVINLEN